MYFYKNKVSAIKFFRYYSGQYKNVKRETWLMFLEAIFLWIFQKQQLELFHRLNIMKFLRAPISKNLLTVASDFLKQIQNSSEQLLLYWLFLLKSDNLLTGYEQLSY